MKLNEAPPQSHCMPLLPRTKNGKDIAMKLNEASPQSHCMPLLRQPCVSVVRIAMKLNEKTQSHCMPLPRESARKLLGIHSQAFTALSIALSCSDLNHRFDRQMLWPSLASDR